MLLQEMIYQARIPYPQPAGLAPNPQMARIIMENYSGQQSELTAITQYTYHHLEMENETLGKALQKIAIVEMHHLEILGRLIRQLGVPPKFIAVRQNRRVPWNAGFIKHGMNPKEMISLDLEGEHAAVKGYERSIRQISDIQVQGLIRRIMQDEALHIKCLEQLLRMV